MRDDLETFVGIINTHAHFFVPNTPITVGRAPGRLDLMGGIADYSGALVLELPLQVATYAAVQPSDDGRFTITSTKAGESGGADLVSLPLAALLPPEQPLTYADAYTLLAADPRQNWAAYVAGVLVVLARERGFHLSDGLRVLIHSEVPVGKGVSSSAALEVATMKAVCGAFQLELNGRDLAMLCQLAENLVVGAPCGVMDQMTSACGEHDRLLALLCQPAELQPAVALPAELEVWGIDSGIRHAVSGADYGSVRVGAFMGYRIIAALAGLTSAVTGPGQVSVDDPYWHGYLANIPPSLWETRYCDAVPVTLSGVEFLDRYGGTTDRVTQVDPGQTYAVRQPTVHPIYEHHRVQLFRALLQYPRLTDQALSLLGELMYQSHASYSACGLGSAGTDRLVELVRAAGPNSGLLGAKITGGGSGGTVAVLARRGSLPAVERISQQYADETGYHPVVLGGSSPGAVQFGMVRLSIQAGGRGHDVDHVRD